MAVPSSPAASTDDSASEKKKTSSDEQMEPPIDGSEIRKAEDSNSKHSDSELTKSGGGGGRKGRGRIGDPQNGKACHQCRQKIMSFAAGCKNMKKDKQCPMKFCHKCLRNRYGEIAEEKEALDDWKCPKCRGICNCSQCMKRRGLKPTGILVHAAKATGFSSVSELLDAKGPEACQQLIVKNKTASSAEGPVSSNRQGKENLLDGTCDMSFSQPPASSSDESSANKANQERLTENAQVVPDDVVRSPMQPANSQEATEKRERMDGDECVDLEGITKKIQKKKAKIKPHKQDASMNDHVVDIVLPPGTLLTSVCGIDLLPEDVGCALHFMEFCATFGEVLDMRNGQPESVLQDIISERGRRKRKYSSAIQFLIQLLSFILKGEEESLSLSLDGDKDSWIYSLKKCISESNCVLEDIPKDCFDQGCDGYEMLLMVKLQDEAAKEVIAPNGGDLETNNSEYDSIVSEIKAEAEQAREEKLKAMDLLPKKRRSDALRTEPIFLDNKGCVYWRLNCFSDSDLLLQGQLYCNGFEFLSSSFVAAFACAMHASTSVPFQCQADAFYADIGDPPYQPVSNEKWFSYDAEEKKVVENRISSLR
ncbi:hypothetical protein Cgig2_022403 [Carnegiea gigantea]|uniref:DDT domain-containing protein n=1 Tax=Carnegiea gigantea TaxID=171969 RepID=A0A9Q1KFD5_9CARY|nr:hypothetical protein Cgig2_022403 [Carnegiea gigantea]